MAEEAHAKLSPSSSERWIACPGSIAAQAAVTEPDRGNNASREGTVAHTLLELCIIFGFRPQEFLGQFIEGVEMPPVVQHMIDGVTYALDWLEEYIGFWGYENLIIVPETRVYIGSMIGVPDEVCNGTADLQIIHKDRKRLVTLDYKHGVKVVEVRDNPQLMLYTAGGIREHGKFKEYHNVIVQPRAAKRRAVDEYTYTQGKLTPFLKEAGKAAKVALMPNAPRVAGDHCTFCKAMNNCETFRRRARQVAADEFGEIEDPESIPDERINDLLKEAHLLRQWVAAIEARALALAQTNPAALRDFTLGWGTRKRVFQDPEAVVEWCRKHKLPVDEYMPRGLLTPKQLEGLLKKLGKYPKAKRGEPKPESPIAHLVGYTTPNPALKPRIANPSAEEDFAEDAE